MNGAPQVTVIICTHNPRRETFGRVLEALRDQTEPRENWELLVVDNCSETPVADWVDVSWHPRGRIVVERVLGSTPAHIRGIREALAPLLVFVDDDNLLAPSYIGEAVRIAAGHGFLGAWGGAIRGEYEVAPPAWASKWLGLLAIHDCRRISWSNEPYGSQSTPVGAGMCIRKSVADAYVARLESDPHRPRLGRVGTLLMGCEDTEMALTSLDLGLGVGMFPQLVLTHVIPAQRLTAAYFERIAEGREASIVVMRAMRGDATPHAARGSLARRLYWWWTVLSSSREDRRLLLAQARGHRRGEAMAREVRIACAPGRRDA